MSEVAAVRRHLYEEYVRTPLRARRRRRALRRQIALLAAASSGPAGGSSGQDGGSAGVREPRRPLPPHSGPGRALLPPG